MLRRQFTALLGLGSIAALAGCLQSPALQPARRRRLLFTSDSRTCLINDDGSGLRILECTAPGQVKWQPGPLFPDGRRVILLSLEARHDTPGLAYKDFLQTKTHLWVHDLDSGALTEIAVPDRIAGFRTPQLLLGEDRLLVQVTKDGSSQVYLMKLDGTDVREFTRAGEGVPYGFSVSSSGQRVAFHLATSVGYQIWTSDPDGTHRQLIAAHPDHLYFGPTWSPDGDWLLFLDCRFKDDPAKDGADLCLARPDGTGLRSLTSGESHWFDATYGRPGRRGSGSNLPSWTPDGHILFSRRLPGSKVAWEFQARRPDVDHFNRDWKPELARGGSEIVRLDPANGSITPLTSHVPPAWDFRAATSTDGRKIAFCRCNTGDLPALWTMSPSGGEARLLTTGINGLGADQPRWLPIA